MRESLPSREAVERRLREDRRLRRLCFETSGVGEWDSGLLTFVTGLERPCRERGVALDPGGLPEGARNLLRLARSSPPETAVRRAAAQSPWLARVGQRALAAGRASLEGTRFLGETMLSLGRLCAGRAQLRGVDVWEFTYRCGAQALPIVSLISFLVGLVLGYVGVQQLSLFGVEIFAADLVAIAATREMAPIMTGILMAGRTGAAFAAQLGTMTVNEEIDALRTLGISPIDFLVLPRMLALIAMVPLLCLYADLLGIVGGAVAAIPLGDLSPQLYANQTIGALDLRHVWIGVAKSAVFGVLVALAGCLRGLQSGRSAQAVGEAATSAVVLAIVWIIVCDAIFAVCLATLEI